MNSLISPSFIPVSPPLRYLYFQRISIMFKLVLWATLVFFSYGSQLQIGTALLLCVGRLALHAQFEPYRMTMDNAFDYVTLTITALFGLGGIMLQSMETFKNFAIYRGDERGSEASKSAISVVEMALNIMVVTVFVAFAFFWLHSLWLKRRKISAVLRGVVQSAVQFMGKRCPCMLRCARRCCSKCCCSGVLNSRRNIRATASSAASTTRVGTRPITHENDTGGGLEMSVRSGEIKRRTRLASTNQAGGAGGTGSAVASVGRTGSTEFAPERNPMWTGHEKAGEEKPIDESRNNRLNSLVRERVSSGWQTSLVETGSRAQNPLHCKGGVEADSRRIKADRGPESRETAPPRIGRRERTWSGNPVDHLTKKDFESMDAVTGTGNVTVRIVDQAGDADDDASDGGADASGVGEVGGGGAGEITTDNGCEAKTIEVGMEKETTASTLVQRRDDDNIMIEL